MKKDSIIDFLGFIAVKALSGCLRIMPLRCALWLGRRVGDIVYTSNAKRRSIAYTNLKSAFPLKDAKELKRINRAHFRNLTMNIVELLKLPFMGKEYLDVNVEIQGVGQIKDAIEKGKGVILLTAHFGNWEISSLAASARGYTMYVFARTQKYKRLNALLNQYRESTGCRVITKGFSVRDIIRTLQQRGIVGMLADQDAGLNGVFVDFLGRPASMAQGPVVFSMKTGAQVFLSFIRRVGPHKHIARVGEPLKFVNTESEKDSMKGNLQRIADILAEKITQYPAEWLWSHKRWKSTPQRTILVLSDGKAGHLNQALAVAEIFKEGAGWWVKGGGKKIERIFKEHVAEIRFKNKFTRILLDIVSLFATKRCQGCLGCLKFCLTKESFDAIKNRYADIIISCGASITAVNVFLKYENNAKNIVIMKPGFGRSKKFDVMIMPRHDVPGKPGKNVAVVDAAPNRISERAMREAVERVKGEGWRVEGGGGIGVLIGGDTKGFELRRDVIEKLMDNIIKIADEMDMDIFISTSRRTPKDIEFLLKTKLTGHKRCKLLVIANEHNPPDTVPLICGLSKALVVSPESVSMISEAVSSGKQVIVFGKAEKNKYGKFVDSLEKQGYVKIAEPEKIYNTIKDIVTTEVQPKRLEDKERIIEKLKGLV